MSSGLRELNGPICQNRITRAAVAGVNRSKFE